MNDRVLVISGLDPSGGAGIAADIETLNQFGVTPLPLVSVLTVQNTESVTHTQSVDLELLEAQFQHLRQDVDIQVVKLGLLGASDQIGQIARWLGELDKPRVVLDPIIRATSGAALRNTDATQALLALLPQVEVLTPNAAELAQLAPDLGESQAVQSLPCPYILVTNGDADGEVIEHRLYVHGTLFEHYAYHKLPGSYHGSGCTLASAISALMASGVVVEIAVKQALDYTYQSLLNAKTIGKMQFNPNRQKPA